MSSNYRPLIEESDTGTWRRLALCSFPFHFRPPGDALAAATDRVGDPRLRSRVRGTKPQEAVLNWIVEGARAWYDAGEVMPPLPGVIAEDSLSWRVETDSVLAYITDRLIADPAAHIPAQDLTLDFGQHLLARGQHEWSDRTLAARFSTHEWVVGHRVEKRKTRAGREGCSRAQHRAAPLESSTSFKAWFGVRFRTTADDLKEAPKDPVPDVPGKNKLSYTHTYGKVTNDPEHPEGDANPQVSRSLVPAPPAVASDWCEF